MDERDSTSAADAGERNGRDAEVGGDVVLRNAAHDVGMLRQQLLVALPGRVPDARKKEQLTGPEAFDEFLLIGQPQRRHAVDKRPELVPSDDRQLRRFEALQRKKARPPGVQAVERSDEIALEEELERNLFPVVAEKQPQAALADQIEPVGHPALLQQHRLGRHGEPFGRSPDPFREVARADCVGRIGRKTGDRDHLRQSVGIRGARSADMLIHTLFHGSKNNHKYEISIDRRRKIAGKEESRAEAINTLS